MQIIPAVMFAATIMLAASALAYSEEYQFIRDKTGDIDWAAECKRRPSVPIGMTRFVPLAASKRCRASSAGGWSITVWRSGDGGPPELDVF
jgi:hypothetical protein